MHLGPLLSNNKSKSIILGILLHHVISVHDPHLALTDITWSSASASDLLCFVGHCDLYFMHK